MLAAAKRLMQRGELTQQQYEEMCRRNERIAHEDRIDKASIRV